MDFLPFMLPLSSLPLLVVVVIIVCQLAREEERREALKWRLVETALDNLKEKMIKELCTKESERDG